MPLLLMAMVWHARRREAAIRAVRRMAATHHALLEREHELLRDTSHAIRTPVTIARGFLDLALDDPAGPELVDHLEVISRQLERSETLSARLLSLSALDAGEHRSSDMIDLTAVVRSVSHDWAVAEDRQWVHDSGPTVWILGDETELQSAVDALIENAIHFTCPSGTIRVSCYKIEGFAVVEVADSGPGISEADVDFVFQRFWHRTPPDGLVGSGLGLSMVWSVCEAHGGLVTAGRAPEGGALFTMTFPRPTIIGDRVVHGGGDHSVPYGPTTKVTYTGAPAEPAKSRE
jgi:signal transduction histidine kinase